MLCYVCWAFGSCAPLPFYLTMLKLAYTIQFNITIPLLISKVCINQPWSTGSTLVRTQTFLNSISLRSINRDIDAPVIPF